MHSDVWLNGFAGVVNRVFLLIYGYADLTNVDLTIEVADMRKVADWAREHGVSRVWAYELIRQGRLDVVRDGVRMLVTDGAEARQAPRRFATPPAPDTMGIRLAMHGPDDGVTPHMTQVLGWRWAHSTTPVARCDHVCRSCGSVIVTGTRYLRYLKATWGRSGGAVCWPCAVLVAPIYSRPGWGREDSDGRKGWRGVWHKGGEIIGHGLRWPCRALDEALAADRAATEL